MPSNSTGQLAIWRNASALAAFALSPQDYGVRVSAIPDPSCTVALPPVTPTTTPGDGDAYSILDADGSCSSSHEIIITPPTGTTIRGASSFTLNVAFAWAVVTYDNESKNWTVELGGADSGGGGGALVAVVYSPTPTVASTSIISARSANQSPNTSGPLTGATNLGSDTSGSTTGVSADYATVLGGDQCVASAEYAAVVGGFGDVASGDNSFVGGGDENTASGVDAAVVGGGSNVASGDLAFVGGGTENTASGPGAVVGGGEENTASGTGAAVAGGFINTASGDFSSAAGEGAIASRTGQQAHTNGTINSDTPGSFQKSEIVFTGTGAGKAAIFLTYGATETLALEDGKAYTLRMSLVAVCENTPPRKAVAMFAQAILTCDAGIATLVDSSQDTPIGTTALLVTTSLQFSVDGTDNEVSIVWSTGANGSADDTYNVAANLQIIETVGP